MLASKVLRHKKPRLRILVSFVQDSGRGSSLAAADILIQEGISAEVIDVFSVKPFDEYAIFASAAKTGRVVSVKEHNVATGLGAAVAELLAEKLPTPMRFAGMRTFGIFSVDISWLTQTCDAVLPSCEVLFCGEKSGFLAICASQPLVLKQECASQVARSTSQVARSASQVVRFALRLSEI